MIIKSEVVPTQFILKIPRHVLLRLREIGPNLLTQEDNTIEGPPRYGKKAP